MPASHNALISIHTERTLPCLTPCAALRCGVLCCVACNVPICLQEFMAKNASPGQIVSFLFGEFTFAFMDFCTADPFAVCWPTH
jgi:hypothetical protein